MRIHDRPGHAVTRAGSTRTFVLLALATALATPAFQATAANNPIPGVDIIVQKKPGGSAIHRTSDASGQVSIRLAEPGHYTITTSCGPRRCPSHTAMFSVSGAPLKPVPGAANTFEFNVAEGQAVVLTGEVRSPDVAAGTAGDADAGAARASINTSRSNIRNKVVVGAPTKHAEHVMVDVSTTRSTSAAGEGTGAPAEAPVVTSRSNK
jgi:hypothetical protein